MLEAKNSQDSEESDWKEKSDPERKSLRMLLIGD